MNENPRQTLAGTHPKGPVFTETVSRSFCPACGEGGSRVAFTDINRREGLPLKGTFVACTHCETLYLREIPAPNALASAYSTGLIDPSDEEEPTGSSEPSPRRAATPTLTDRVFRSASRLVRGRPHSWPEEPGEGRRILDFGCGSGAKLVEFEQRGWQIAGIDLRQSAITHARATLPSGQWFSGPIEAAPDWGRFDVVRTDNVVEHLPQPLEILSALRERLAVNGRLFVYVPNGRSLSIRLLRGRSQASWIPFHLQLFSPRGLALLLGRAGFATIALRQFTPLSWWEQTARQLVSAPGFLQQPPGATDRVAIWAARSLAPLWILAAGAGLGEELVAEAR